MENSPPNAEQAQDEKPTKKVLQLPLDDEQVSQLRAGEWVYLEGSLYVIGWQASQRLLKAHQDQDEWPIDCHNELIFHATVNTAPWGKVIGSIGPEYAARYDELDEILLESGARGLLARGPRPPELIEALKHQRGLYLVVPSGASALLARTIHQSEIVAYPELELDAIRRVKVSYFPAIVAIDGFGRNLLQKTDSTSPQEELEEPEETHESESESDQSE